MKNKLLADRSPNLDLTAFNDQEAQRIGEFLHVLPDVVSIKPMVPGVKFDDEMPIHYAQKRFLAYEYDGRSTFYVNPSIKSPPPEDCKLSFTPLVARGGKRSAHGVFFGTLRIGESPIRVAVKPHMSDVFTTGLDDYFKTHAVSKLGVYTLTPAGLLLPSRDKDQSYSMTVLEEGLSTLDSINWADYYPRVEQNLGMQELWRGVSGQSAVLHAEGNKSHGDMAARNIATSAEDTVFFIDWEHALLSNQPPRDAESRYAHSYKDLSVLLESMCLPPHADIGGRAGIGIFYGKKGDWWEGFCEVFFNEYKHVRMELAKSGHHHKKTEAEVTEEVHELSRSLRANLEMWRDVCANIPPLHRSATSSGYDKKISAIVA